MLPQLLSAERVARRAENRSGWLLGAFSLLYFGSSYLIATRRVLWHDELYTLSLSALPHRSDIWTALVGGGDMNPPLFYWITRASLALVGMTELGVRLPAMLGFWIMCLSLYRFTAVATSRAYGLVAAFLPLFTGAYYYASEGRPYGLVLGFAALALVFWQSAIRQRYRLASLLLLSLSLAAALANHYYAGLVFVALAIGESVRTIHRRQIDWAIWSTFVLGALPLLLFAPLLKAGLAEGGAQWSPARWSLILDFYAKELAPMTVVLLLLLVLAALYTSLVGSERHSPDADDSTPPWHETAAACGFAFLPFVAVVLGKFASGGFTDRYAITAIIGVCILIAFTASRLLRGQVAPCLAFVAALSIWFVIAEIRHLEAVTFARGAQAAAIAKLQSMTASVNLPIVAADAHTIVELAHYAPREITARLVYLNDPEISRRRLGYDSTELEMVDYAKPRMGLDVQPFGSYVSSHPDFFVFGRLANLCWVVPELVANGWRVEMLSQADDQFLLRFRRS